MEKLECGFCGRRFSLDVFNPFCQTCNLPLLYAYPPGPMRRFHPERAYPLDRYLDFLPLAKVEPDLGLGEGNTPLLLLRRLSRECGLPATWAKNESVNPSFSFKDRGTVVAVQKAVSLGLRRIGAVSTGNMAASTAAYGARAGLETYVLLKEGASRQSLISAGIYGPRCIAVAGDYGKLFWRSYSLGRKSGIYFMNSVDPFRIEGYKLAAFEIFAQLGNAVPGVVIVPVSAGGHLLGILRAFDDLKEIGLVQDYPVIVGVQAAGCAPLARAFASGHPNYDRIGKARTIAHAISNPAPAAGNLVLKWIRDRKGLILAVTDKEILASQKLLAQTEGIFCQPESATTVAALLKLRGDSRLRGRKDIVLIITGSGLKSLKPLESQKIKIVRTDVDHLEKTLSSRPVKL